MADPHAAGNCKPAAAPRFLDWRGGHAIGKSLYSRKLLTNPALDRIEKAVAQAEGVSRSEFIVVIAPASARYEGRGLRAAAAVALIVFLSLYNINVLAYGVYSNALMLLVEALVIGGVAALLFARVDMLRRLLIPAPVRRAAVQRAASAVFTEERVTLTRERNAVLVYISVLEGEALILPDIGLNDLDAKIGEVQGALVSASGDAVDLLCDAIVKLGEICSNPFPMQPGDVNELPDRPRVRLP